MGTTVYDAAEPIREGAHVYAHSRADGKPGKAYLVINNSLTDTTTVTLPKEAEVYQLSAETLRSQTMLSFCLLRPARLLCCDPYIVK